jgi:hypothetical protein
MLGWVLRIGAWTVVAYLLLRPAVCPRRAWLDGRLQQLRVLSESRGAGRAFLRELGLDRHFDPARFSVASAGNTEGGAPAWLTIVDRSAPSAFDGPGFLLVQRDGTVPLPPLSNAQTQDVQWVSVPEYLYLTGSEGTKLPAAVAMRGTLSGKRQDLVWLNRGGRWRNVLNIQTGPGKWRGDLDPFPARDDAVGVAFERAPDIRFAWDPQNERFLIPEALDPDIKILDLLPDQTGE